MLGVHAGERVDLGWELFPLGVGDTGGDLWEQGSVSLVLRAHAGDKESEQDAGHDENQKGGTPELKVLSLGGFASSPDEVSAPHHAETTSDGGDVDDDQEVTVGSGHLLRHIGHGVGHTVSLTG